jgi:hypothetical protein
MKQANEVIPWTVTDISIRPYDGYWSMNPSLHYDGQTWRCVLRCTDYAMPDGKTIRSHKARSAGIQTKNAMVVFDPASWKPIQIYKMHERDDHPRTPCANVGYEDMRIFRTDKGGLQGVAASLHLERDRRPTDGGAHNHPPEQVLVSFDEEYNIIGARPIRGDSFSGMPQKNWAPFDGCAEPRFLYSIVKGKMFDERGAVHGDAAMAHPSTNALPLLNVRPQSAPAPSLEDRERQERETREEREKQELMEARERQRKREEREQAARRMRPDLHLRTSTGNAVVRGRRVSHDSVTTRPSYTASRPTSARPSSANAASSRPYHIHNANTDSGSRVLGTGRTILPKYEGLRGGTQLVRVADDAWLGIGHEMKYLNNLKMYWHTWYLVNSRGALTATSEPMKLASNRIEFAAGMAIDGDRVVVSFGVDDMECKIAETSLAAVMGTLRPIER